ncbi:MAG TPA: type I-E CRISPR-associated protein Cas5/CasD [Mycobacteriales bacterium]|nr:type I-E CRISPR-associated protein Cas5/CasD [Mycobacteriales bacterium]
MDGPTCCLVLRLAGPLQSWGRQSQFNRRETGTEPTKSGIVGLLAAAQGRRRTDPIEDLLDLRLGVRIDQPGSLLRDYHTVSDYRGGPLPSAAVNSRGVQKPTSPAKPTHVTERFYLQDAAFVAAVAGPPDVLATLRDAVRHPAFPLALGRRACVPTQPVFLPPGVDDEDPRHPGLWAGDLLPVLRQVAWQVPPARAGQRRAGQAPPATVHLPVTLDDPEGDDTLFDLPTTFDPKTRSFAARRVRHTWVPVRNPEGSDQAPDDHDPFALLDW